jgi:hypothetical protein
MRYEIRPLGTWTEPVTKPRKPAQFRVGWAQTEQLLGYEAAKLGAHLVVIQIDVAEQGIRLDGKLRAHAEAASPRVRVAFESRHGPLTYAADRYTRWQDNVRAIALALEALRAVDRYGVSSRGEQYRGWVAIEARPAEMTREQAAGLIAHWAEPEAEKRERATTALLRSPSLFVPELYRRAAKRAHPDVTGDDGDTMGRLNAARDLLLEADRG